MDPFHAIEWIEANRDSFRPPTGSRVISNDDDFLVMLIAGPNARDDYHVNPHGEIFYQLRGTISVGYVDDDGSFGEAEIREGEMWYCPSFRSHQPRRPADTYGLVIERPSLPDEINLLTWYCSACDSHLHTEEFSGSPGPDVFKKFTGVEDWRTCVGCGHRTLNPAT